MTLVLMAALERRNGARKRKRKREREREWNAAGGLI